MGTQISALDRFTADMRSLSKSYGATVALEDVSLSIRPGEIQALLGENGAGKSTLVKVLSGVVRPDTGRMTLDSAPYRPARLIEARAAGVSTAFQELSLVPNLSVAQNFFLPGSLRHAGGLISVERMNDAVTQVLAAYGVTDVAAGATVDSLSLAARQRIEIVRAMYRQPKLLILDEPTGALADVDWLFGLVRRVTQQGTAVLYISHRLAEIRELASSATILRSGRSISTVALNDVSDADIFEMMVGRRATHSLAPSRKPEVRPRVDALVLNDLTGKGFDSVSLRLARGEVLGVAALEGQGQRELFRTLAGQSQPVSGQIVMGGRPVRFKNPAHALTLQGGVAFVAEDRKNEGIFPHLTTAANVTQSVLRRMARCGVISARHEARSIGNVAPQVELERRYLRFRIGNLSGGNQQKALIARALLTGAKTLLLFDPTRGVDVGTKEIIYQAIDRFAEKGGSVLVYSTELAELIRMSDRCLVMYDGKVRADLPREQLDERELVALMTGHAG
ncbi:sugar ABC transporter ATP-binding protein [Paraburkholderia silvatlantica]|uniref:Ribose transport system ATP-binding protein n=1 Tax=Paraburkholderia silvatlantica TaxID=321895 RepID=A0ABR6FKC7_9BURK|nr:sugar ABC transporter ATP-binding protein [Paraburkholderia silvatlantica]MBB2927878.1 ribose transport system ATP-binding protein [Paraburkholderia silvatlantica]PVY27557.1 ribose transport system ATP-binding protein [Paraburkholderia silvatlantica]PXW34530.1 ribose transport system ATP-binding protein [Paraburkholderia silvatlantica]